MLSELSCHLIIVSCSPRFTDFIRFIVFCCKDSVNRVQRACSLPGCSLFSQFFAKIVKKNVIPNLMVIFWITFQNISIFLWISILPEPTVPLFFRRLETSRNTSYNLPATILTKMISSYLYIHIRPRRIHLQHQCLVQDFLMGQCQMPVTVG